MRGARVRFRSLPQCTVRNLPVLKIHDIHSYNTRQTPTLFVPERNIILILTLIPSFRIRLHRLLGVQVQQQGLTSQHTKDSSKTFTQTKCASCTLLWATMIAWSYVFLKVITNLLWQWIDRADGIIACTIEYVKICYHFRFVSST